MISYAQNHEDVVLARAFGEQVRGFYVDVGAEHPVVNSVTRHFYGRGWRGINIEPSPSALGLLEQERPEDINLGIGLADFEGKATLFEGPPGNHGASTFRPDVAERYVRLGHVFREIADVPVTTLALVCEEYVGDRTIDLLKIDVEGMEGAVIEGADWNRWRPRVVVVEATEPNDRRPTHDPWEPHLLAAGYAFALFDGLNRFYAREDEPELLRSLAAPACVFDDFIDARWERERGELKAEADTGRAARASLAAVEQALAEQSAVVAQQAARLAGAEHHQAEKEAEAIRWRAEARQWERRARIGEDRLRHAEDENLRAELGAAALRDRVAAEVNGRLAADRAIAAEQAARQAVERELAALRSTKLFRWMAPFRSVYAFLRKL